MFLSFRNKEMPEPDSTEIEQLRRTAEMFEMILQANPGAIENYESLKEIYRKSIALIRRRASSFALRSSMFFSEPAAAKNELEHALKDFPEDEQISAKLAELGFTAAMADVPQLMHEYETLCMKCEDINSKRLLLEMRFNWHALLQQNPLMAQSGNTPY